MNDNRLLLAAVVILITVISSAPALKAEQRKIIKLGAIYGLTGPLADLSVQMKNGALLAVEKVNNSTAEHIEVLFEDSKYDAKLAVSALNKLITINKIRIVHVLGTPPTLAVKPITEAKGVLLLAAAAHADVLKDSHYTIRHSNNAFSDSRILAEAIAREKPEKVIAIYSQNEWAESYRQHFEKHLLKFTGVKLQSESHLPDESDYRSLLMRLMRSKPDVIAVISLGAAPGLIIKQLKEFNFPGKIYANNGLSLSPDGIQIIRNANINGFHYQTYPEAPAVFQRLYKERYGEQAGIFALTAFTDFELIGQALANVGSDPKNIIAYIQGLGEFRGSFETVKISPQGDIVINTVVKEWN